MKEKIQKKMVMSFALLAVVAVIGVSFILWYVGTTRVHAQSVNTTSRQVDSDKETNDDTVSGRVVDKKDANEKIDSVDKNERSNTSSSTPEAEDGD